MRDVLVKYHRFLAEIIECEFGLIDELVSSRILSFRHECALKALEQNLYKQNKILFNILCNTDTVLQPSQLFKKFNKFINALNETHQSHISVVLQTGKIYFSVEV